MVDIVLDWVSWLMLLSGGLVAVIGGIGLLRFPDIYTRLHAGGMTDTLCMLLIIGGLILQSGLSILSIKLALILLFMLFTAPTAAHALARAAMVDGVEPQTGEGEPSSNT
ncbi:MULTISPECIES: monovalent cation/H(+) antiporter subunit G [unclassified Wenzhouxiangella]|uniref:monovalent cation/H(+) antiporter subunit G n=1 Tax=unclassified Wenzhouxiangella TaxID=2613841 RepID=UPI000E32980F|nr:MULTISPECIES: monovalent cation/H(+) antiporter subunit G [unclassified Wenzhouxiangella]RFF28396.1 sodium:proton antiporter [Wenzhouxiangella sp. 15181]RFP69913.1 sodium:proton antiporter [Wenzhouxiangella sp. 15190]